MNLMVYSQRPYVALHAKMMETFKKRNCIYPFAIITQVNSIAAQALLFLIEPDNTFVWTSLHIACKNIGMRVFLFNM